MAKWSEVMASGGSAAAQPMGLCGGANHWVSYHCEWCGAGWGKQHLPSCLKEHNPFLDDDPCPTCKDGVCQCGPDEDECPNCGDPICDCWLEDDDESTLGLRGVYVNEGYHDLFDVLRDALDQAQNGKGEERHGNGLSFTGQPALTITRAVGLGFPLGQAMKKIQECQRMDPDAAKRELLGAINYLAAAILFLDE